MRDYAKIRPVFWTRGTGKKLRGDPEAQVVALYLMSAPLSHMTGLAPRRIAYIRKFPTHAVSESGLLAGSRDEDPSLPGVQRVNPEDVWMEYVYHDMDKLNRQILEWRTGLHGREQISNNEIARRLNISPSAVTQRWGRIAQKLDEGAEVMR